jgi:diamine N-acetyltransferase
MYTISNATKDDIGLIRELTFQVWPQTYESILSKDQIDYMLELMYSVSSLQKQMDTGSQFVILYNDERPVGFASFEDQGKRIWKLHKIYVLQDQQGKGGGRFLLDHVIDNIKQQGAEKLQLQVNRNNKARSFYEKLGFYELTYIELDIGNGYFMKDFIMEKKVG